MSVSKVTTSLVAVAVFVAFVAVGRSASFSSERVTVSGGETRQLTDEKRYKVPVSLSQPRRGAEHALVTVVEWCDLQSEPCQKLDGTMRSLLTKFSDSVRHVFRHLPAQASESSLLAHEFARIAHEQAGKFWEVRALLMASKQPLASGDLPAYSAQVDMDFAGVSSALERHSHAGYVAADGLFASKFGVTEAPALFVNGRRLLGAPTPERLGRLIESELAFAKQLVAKGVSVDNVYDEVTSDGLWACHGCTP